MPKTVAEAEDTNFEDNFRERPDNLDPKLVSGLEYPRRRESLPSTREKIGRAPGQMQRGEGKRCGFAKS